MIPTDFQPSGHALDRMAERGIALHQAEEAARAAIKRRRVRWQGDGTAVLYGCGMTVVIDPRYEIPMILTAYWGRTRIGAS